MNVIEPGDKSEVLDIDSPDLERFPNFVKARRFECILEPGDLLFIPGNFQLPFNSKLLSECVAYI